VLDKSTSEAEWQVFKALGHPTRLKIVEILATEGGKCVCELVDRVGFDQSTVSKHLALMRSVGLVAGTKDGLRVTYELSMPCVYQFMECLARVDKVFACVGQCAAQQRSLGDNPQVK